MPLDLVAAKQWKTLDGSQPVFSLAETLHAAIFSLATPRKEFPVTMKLKDYYSDTVLLFGELARFVHEMHTIASASVDKNAFSGLLSFVEQAIAGGNNIYVQSD